MNNQIISSPHLKSRKSESYATRALPKNAAASSLNEPEKHKPETFSKQVLLTIASLVLFLSIQNFFGKAVFEKVKGYKQEFRSGLGNIPEDSLMGSRFGLDYLLPRHLAKIMKPRIPILLTPPVQYTKKFITQQAAHSLTNPLYLFYMNQEIRTVTMESPEIAKANCTILLDKEGRCYPMMITNKDQLNFATLLFRNGEPYNPTIQ